LKPNLSSTRSLEPLHRLNSWRRVSVKGFNLYDVVAPTSKPSSPRLLRGGAPSVDQSVVRHPWQAKTSDRAAAASQTSSDPLASAAASMALSSSSLKRQSVILFNPRRFQPAEAPPQRPRWRHSRPARASSRGAPPRRPRSRSSWPSRAAYQRMAQRAKMLNGSLGNGR